MNCFLGGDFFSFLTQMSACHIVKDYLKNYFYKLEFMDKLSTVTAKLKEFAFFKALSTCCFYFVVTSIICTVYLKYGYMYSCSGLEFQKERKK